jgi:hypothetical protein
MAGYFLGQIHWPGVGRALATAVVVAAPTCGSDGVLGDALGASKPARFEAKASRSSPVAMSDDLRAVEVDQLIATQQAKLLPVDGQAGKGFGYSAGVSGDAALLGAPSDGDIGLPFLSERERCHTL